MSKVTTKSPRSRSRRKGSIQRYETKKSGTRWRYQLWVPRDPDYPDLGMKKHSKAGFLTADEADDAMQEALVKRKNNERFSGRIPKLGAYAELWLESRPRLEASTLKGYRKHIRNHVIPQLGEVRLDHLTPSRLAHHYRDLERSGRKDYGHVGEPLSPNTVQHVNVLLGSILDAAVEDGHISVNPAKKKAANPPTASEVLAARPEITTWNGQELRTVLDWIRDDPRDELYALWLIFAFTGMRRSEVLALRWNDLNSKTGRISIRRAVDTVHRHRTKTPKTGTYRVIDVDDEVISTLNALKTERAAISFELVKPDAYIFSTDDGNLRSPSSVTSLWARRLTWLQQVHPEISRVDLKGLRHTHATILLEQGVSPKVIQERLGHTTITTTMNVYSHVTPTMQRAAVKEFTRTLASA